MGKRIPTSVRVSLFALAVGAVSAPALADDAAENSGLLTPVGKQLATNGIILNADYYGEFASNLSGGRRQGSEYTDQLSFGGDADLQKLIGLEGGAFHLQFSNRDGRNLAGDTINNSVSVQQLYGGGQTLLLSTLTYEQKLFGGVLDIQGGRTEIGQVAFQDPIYCDFQTNAICGEPPIMGKDSNSSFYPVPVWGAWATVTPAKDFYALTGVFDNDPGQANPAHQSFDWGLDQSQGAQIPVEAGYQTSFADDDYPRRYDVGAIFDQSPYAHTEFDAATASLDSVGARDRSLIYLQAKQMVFRPDMREPRGLTAFGAVAYGPDNTQPVDYSLTAGAVYQGLFASRPKDTLGVVISETHYRDNFITQLYDFRLAALGGTERPASDLVMTEVNYDAFATDWFDVMPNVQYIVNPDGLGNQVYPKSNLNDAFVVGIQVHINLAALAGLPSSSQ